MSLAVIEPVRPSYSNRVSCSLQIVGQSSISIPQQFLYNYCRSPSVAYFTFDSYSLITVVTATAADLCIVDNNRLPFSYCTYCQQQWSSVRSSNNPIGREFLPLGHCQWSFMVGTVLHQEQDFDFKHHHCWWE
jgi:hypothetical protein